MTFVLKLFLAVGSIVTFAACAADPLDPPGGSGGPVSAISISPSTANVAVDGTLQLSAVIQNSRGTTLTGRAITWTSDVQRVATVSAGGLVRAADTGKATITATSEGQSARATVTVTRDAASRTGAAAYFVSPTGSSSADGSLPHPWDLGSALTNAAGLIQPGDTVWLRGGTYRGNFRSTLQGTSAKPIVVRQYPGERAIIDGNGAPTSASTLFVTGEYTVFWGFELTNSYRDRMLSSTQRRPNVVANYANHTKYINLVIHDGGVGFYNDSPYYDVEIAGCIIYNEGFQRFDRGHGHAIYLRSNTGPVTARENILFNQFGYGVHVFTNRGEGQLRDIRIEGNVSFNNGTLSTIGSSSNILFGGDAYSTGGVIKSNYTYYSPAVAAVGVQVGWGLLKNGTVQLLDNYFAGGDSVLNVGYWSSLTATSNRLVGAGTLVTLSDRSMSTSKFSGQTSSLPTTTKVVVRPTPYEPGRANIVVYNWGQLSSVSVDLSGIVPVGAAYVIRNVQDWFGAPVVGGTYAGGSITLPIRSVQPPVPVGFSTSRSPSTGTTFGVYVVSIRQ
jgi:hypothetical protein